MRTPFQQEQVGVQSEVGRECALGGVQSESVLWEGFRGVGAGGVREGCDEVALDLKM